MNTAAASQYQASDSLKFEEGLASPQRRPKDSLRCSGDQLLVQFPDGSSFYLGAEAVLRRAAEQIAIAGISPLVHLQEQLLPAVLEMPSLLVDIARQLPWTAAFALAFNPFWNTPVSLQGARYWADATITILPARR